MSERSTKVSALAAMSFLPALASVAGTGLRGIAQSPDDAQSASPEDVAEPLDWYKIPSSIHPMPRPGFFPVPPT